jgi:5-formyltetrahydrofolate cyclo-ligase
MIVADFANNEAVNAEKQALRREFLARRRAMTAEEAANLSGRLCDKLVGLLAELELPQGVILSYLAYGREANLAALHERLLRENRRLAVPVTAGLPKGIMQAVEYTAETELQKTELGVFEPVGAPQVLPSEISAVLVPGVAFDEHGGRMGHGAGYYDRFFQALAEGARLIGVAYDWQIAPHVPTCEWDRSMNFIVTDSRILQFR